MAEWEEKANAGQDLQLQAPWDDPFVKEWLTLPPRIADHDLRGVLYVSREHAPLISPQDRLSSEAAELLAALLTASRDGCEFERTICRKFRERKSQSSWIGCSIRRGKSRNGACPPSLKPASWLPLPTRHKGRAWRHSCRIVPAAQIKPNIVPKIGDQPWASSVFDKWEKSTAVSTPVKKAIEQRREDGNVRVQ